MLNELKEELEYCRRKWTLAREKNNESQSQWNDLRSEFSKRKLQDASGESGYSDEPVSDDDNSDDEPGKAIRSELPTGGESSEKQDSSVPPISTFLAQVFQTTSEIVPANLTLEASVVSKSVESLDLNYAARTSVVKPKTAAKITVKKVACEMPSTSKSGAKSKCVDEVRPRLSRELRKKTTKVKEKRKGEETLEEMFFRLSGQEPPQPEASTSDDDEEPDEEENDDEEHEDEIEANPDVNHDEIVLLEADVEQLTPHLVTEESSNPEDISNMILSEEDEQRRAQRAARFLRLEEQCQQLITQVINNSTRGDELNLHLDNVQRRFTPLRENSKSIDKSDEGGAAGCSTEVVPTDDTECLTQREQEYTSRRAERLKRLEEECKEFLNKRTRSNIRAHEMSNKLDRLHERYGSQESSEASTSSNCDNKGVVLTEEEEAYAARRAERLKRLEEQSVELLEKMAQSSSRAKNIESNLDALHNKFGDKEYTEIDSQVTEECNVHDEIIDVIDVDIAQEDVPVLLQSDPSDDQNASTEVSEDQIVYENAADVDEETL